MYEVKYVKEKKEQVAEKRGITLIALVVTLIVLLILAGVCIALLTGENGIIKQAMQAKRNSREAAAREKLELILSDAQIIRKTDSLKTIEELPQVPILISPSLSIVRCFTSAMYSVPFLKSLIIV
ncbi:MAG: hypothetical protein HFJ55_05715 [Clostridia bacterium]|nr:hypothetical protein [Clostridia bacterium]